MSEYKVTRATNGDQWILPSRAAVANVIAVDPEEFDRVDGGEVLDFGIFTVEQAQRTKLYVISAKDIGGTVNTWIIEDCGPGHALRTCLRGLSLCKDDPEQGEAEISMSTLHVGEIEMANRQCVHQEGRNVTEEAVAEYEVLKQEGAAPSPSV